PSSARASGRTRLARRAKRARETECESFMRKPFAIRPGLSIIKSTMNEWESYRNSVLRYPEMGFALDTSRMGIPSEGVGIPRERIEKAFADLAAIEAGEIMNPDEGRAVGHYWLRKPELAPEAEGNWIRETKAAVAAFADQ